MNKFDEFKQLHSRTNQEPWVWKILASAVYSSKGEVDFISQVSKLIGKNWVNNVMGGPFSSDPIVSQQWLQGCSLAAKSAGYSKLSAAHVRGVDAFFHRCDIEHADMHLRNDSYVKSCNLHKASITFGDKSSAIVKKCYGATIKCYIREDSILVFDGCDLGINLCDLAGKMRFVRAHKDAVVIVHGESIESRHPGLESTKKRIEDILARKTPHQTSPKQTLNIWSVGL